MNKNFKYLIAKQFGIDMPLLLICDEIIFLSSNESFYRLNAHQYSFLINQSNLCHSVDSNTIRFIIKDIFKNRIESELKRSY